MLLRSSCAGVGHDVDRVEIPPGLLRFLHLLEHLVGDLFGDVRPDRDHLVVALAVGDGTFQVLLFDLDDLVAGAPHENWLLGGDNQVIDADGQTRTGGIGKAELLQAVEHLDGLLEPVTEIARLHELLQPFLLQEPVDVGHSLRQRVVENDAADGGVDDLVLDRLNLGVQHVLIVPRRGHVLQLSGIPQSNRRERLELARFERQDHVVGVAERAPLTLCARLRLRQVVAAKHDILRRHRNRRTV